MSHLWFSWQGQRDTALMQTATYSETSVCVYQTTRGHIPKRQVTFNRHIATRFLAFSNNRTAWRVHKEQRSDILQRQTWGLGPGLIVTKLQNISQNPVKQSAKGTNTLQNDRLYGPLTPPPLQRTGILEQFAAGTAFLAANICNILQQHGHRGHKVTPITNTPINDAIAELLIHL